MNKIGRGNTELIFSVQKGINGRTGVSADGKKNIFSASESHRLTWEAQFVTKQV